MNERISVFQPTPTGGCEIPVLGEGKRGMGAVTVAVEPEPEQAPGSLTHCFYLHVDEALDVVLQGLVGLQGDGQVAVVLSVAEVHLDACGPKKGTKPSDQKAHCLG